MFNCSTRVVGKNVFAYAYAFSAYVDCANRVLKNCLVCPQDLLANRMTLIPVLLIFFCFLAFLAILLALLIRCEARILGHKYILST